MAENRPRLADVRLPIPALLLSLALATSGAGCVALARESYTSLRGAGAEALEPAGRFEVSPGRTGSALSHSASLARAAVGPGASVTAAVCDWDPGVWFVAFPPIPIPLLALDPGGARPGTTVVRLRLDGGGTWRANLAALALAGAEGRRAAPDRYALVTAKLDDSLEPCAADVAPRSTVENAELAVFGAAELWLRFPTLDWPDEPRVLEIGGLSLEGRPLAPLRLDFEPGARWFWYRVFP